MKPDAWSRKFLAGKTPLKPDYFDVHDLSSTMGNDVQLLKVRHALLAPSNILSSDDIFLQASSLYFFYPLAGTGGRLAFHPLARKGRLPVHPSCVSIGGTITDFAVDPFDPTRVFVAGDDSSIRVFSLPSDPAEWKEGEVLTEATRTLTGASAQTPLFMITFLTRMFRRPHGPHLGAASSSCGQGSPPLDLGRQGKPRCTSLERRIGRDAPASRAAQRRSASCRFP